MRGPVILLGNPQDNPLIEFLLKEKFLPYTPDPANFPGPGRGYLAWQRDGVGPGQESIVLIAYDEPGIAEAVGSAYEAAAAIEPLTRFGLPDTARANPAKGGSQIHIARVTPLARVPDRVDALRVHDNGVLAASHDGSLVTIDDKDMPVGKVVPPAEFARFVKEAAVPLDAKQQALVKQQARPDRMQSVVAAAGDHVAIAYWGGTLRIVDKGAVRAEQRLPQDITAMAWLGNRLVVGLADGRVLALDLPK